MTRPGAPVIRAAGGRLALRLEPTERRILASLVAELRSELGDPASASPDGSLARLYPPAFPDDAGAEAAYRDLVQDGLVAERVERAATVEATLEADELDETQAAAWLGVLNDLRLALGSRLGIEDEPEQVAAGAGPAAPSAESEAGPDVDDPDAVRRAVFAYLGWLVEAFVDVLAEGLPETPDARR